MATIAQPRVAQPRAGSAKRRRLISAILVNGILALICLLWTIPTVGLLISSFRPREEILTTGWWSMLPHQGYESVEQIELGRGTPVDQPLQVAGATVTDQELRAGVTLPDGRYATWANRRQRIVDIQERRLTAGGEFTTQNYREVLGGAGMASAFITTLVITIPSTLIPILIAAFAAHAFAWMRFPGRRLMFAMVVALLVVPLQVALIPILRAYTGLGINGTYLALWLAHTGFGLPLATYLLYNYISQMPRDIIESAYIDGASNFTIFTRLILPLSVPALASFAIFQFLWTWNDYLVALIFLGGNPNARVMTMRLADIVGSRGQDWHLLTAGAFISMLVPLIVFFSLQRFFVRGMMAGSVKG
ncbi:MAG: carbohydrate ABC transporter permease [Chloroflexota bacterium]|nr:carbohydrate ABC transporter permease [Chloroflexota bacterium]